MPGGSGSNAKSRRPGSATSFLSATKRVPAGPWGAVIPIASRTGGGDRLAHALRRGEALHLFAGERELAPRDREEVAHARLDAHDLAEPERDLFFAEQRVVTRLCLAHERRERLVCAGRLARRIVD